MGLRNFDVVVATPMSISPAIDDIPAPPPDDIFDLILIDEAHHSPAATWNEIIEAFPEAKKILFTATPFRRDKKKKLKENLYIIIQYQMPTKMGFLVRLNIFQ